jgi:hypothetical protein
VLAVGEPPPLGLAEDTGFYLLETIKILRERTILQVQEIVSEITLLGRQGLDFENPGGQVYLEGLNMGVRLLPARSASCMQPLDSSSLGLILGSTCLRSMNWPWNYLGMRICFNCDRLLNIRFYYFVLESAFMV